MQQDLETHHTWCLAPTQQSANAKLRATAGCRWSCSWTSWAGVKEWGTQSQSHPCSLTKPQRPRLPWQQAVHMGPLPASLQGIRPRLQPPMAAATEAPMGHRQAGLMEPLQALPMVALLGAPMASSRQVRFSAQRVGFRVCCALSAGCCPSLLRLLTAAGCWVVLCCMAWHGVAMALLSSLARAVVC